MSLTSKQIEELRAYAKDRKGELAKLINDAADTIEMLSAKLHASQMDRSSQYYHNGWIPCSERLPEEEQTVLVTCSDGQVYIYDRLKACDYEYDDMRFWEDNMGCYQPREDVVAWMPLPEPYQAERKIDEKKNI